ncbi:type III secretion system ATPase SctN [Rouxiella sp. T17]|uniref:type III secretion system ATPase SctN n=1 Tax=Rouxiella sp. T17 TaxID=3085684 RepID=UPI002FCA9989
MPTPPLLNVQAHPIVIRTPIIESDLDGVFIGEICELRRSIFNPKLIGRAQVLGFSPTRTILSLLGHANGLSRESIIHPTGHELIIKVGKDLAGTVVNPEGRIMDSFVSSHSPLLNETRAIHAPAPSWQSRKGINKPLVTGIKVIDALLTCGMGQRIGIFASAGGGKTTLMQMLINNINADIFVIGLVGERGREVAEFMEILKMSGRKSDCVLVFATSDYSSLDRCNSVLIATTIAEYFRDCGKNVVMFIDSITRYARALRDLALSSGEPPARRGYPASVFEALPRVLERAGNAACGSITAFYTILLEGDDETDPIANEIRSILDGHIYLDPHLAAQHHFPAIDVPHSLSRVASKVCTSEHLKSAAAIRRKLAIIDDTKMLIDIGEYQYGQNLENDKAINQRHQIREWLCQSAEDVHDYTLTLKDLHEIAS